MGAAGEHMAETATSRAARLPLSLPTRLDPLPSKEVDRSVPVWRKEEEERDNDERVLSVPQLLVLLLEEKQKFEPRKIGRSPKSKVAALIWVPLLELL